ncbi:DUF1176 domain-containing protein [Pantoea sp. LMR881]|uniref:DUF1176 domain-containing protein n=1 Tax=Pantoea sp. LMR881 TaxID=3014336 RepID=UPI0022AEE656|nr:DUF1176 domain-containing protein [Pantoea sp. LMR881]MCZ4060512.1 DUF1176 domain-containing protein [Pantoea sp. LMR881]
MPYWTKSLFGLSFLCVATVQAEPLQKSFSDWQMTCNNAAFCVARNIPGDNGLVMTISRHAGVNDRPLLRIDYGSAYSGELPGGNLKDNLLIDQRRLKPDLKHWTVEPHHLATSNAIAIDEFLDLVMEAKTLQLTYDPNAMISLRGMKAALLLMDDVQGRVNGMSAWIKRGDRASWDVPPQPVLPQLPVVPSQPAALTQEETSGLIDFGTWRVNTDSCSLDPMRREVSVSPLTDHKALLLVSCEMGAYNVIDLAFEVTRTPPYVARGLSLTLPFTPPATTERQLELINAEYDASTGLLYTFSKGRGLGDCGTATRWQFNGNNFVLAEYAQESTCDAWHSSDDWPTLWVSQSGTAAQQR